VTTNKDVQPAIQRFGMAMMGGFLVRSLSPFRLLGSGGKPENLNSVSVRRYLLAVWV
jgi:hypothetical protein